MMTGQEGTAVSDSMPLVPLADHVAMVRGLAPWLGADDAESLIREYDSYTVVYVTPDGSEWTPPDISYYVKQKIEKEYGRRLYDTLKRAREVAALDKGPVTFTHEGIELMLGFVRLHAPELLNEETRPDDNTA
jgi:hypothetical protein